MVLRIENCNDRRFIQYIVRFIIKYVRSNLDVRKLHHLDNYINSIRKYKTESGRKIFCRDLILLGVRSLVIVRYETYYEIHFDMNKKIAGTNAKLYDACKLINYGNLSVNGYPIFTEAFKYVEENISTVYFGYQWGF